VLDRDWTTERPGLQMLRRGHPRRPMTPELL